MLALGGQGGRVTLVDEATGEVKWTVQPHDGTLEQFRVRHTRVSMSLDGRLVASVGCGDAHWKLWHAASGELHRMGARHDGTGACICAVPLGVVQEGCPVVAHTRELRAVDFSPCGARFATGEDSAVIVWDAQSGNAEHHFLRGFGAWALSFSADGARLASVNSDQSIRVWDATTWALLRTIQASFVASVRLSPTGSRILSSAGGNSLIQFWDVDSGAKIRSIEGREFAVFSPDGRSIATAGAGRNFRDVLLLDAESGALRLRMVGHADNVRSATFSVDDGSKLASGSRDGTCKVWDSSTGALLLTINIGSRVSSVAFGRDWAQRAVAFAAGHHPRLGAGSQVLELEVGVVRMILDRV